MTTSTIEKPRLHDGRGTILLDGTLDQLYGYQIEGPTWMRSRDSYGLFDEPGLGKSVQALVDFAQERQRRDHARLLVTAPNEDVAIKWAEDEIPKWTTLSVELALGTAKQRANAISAGADATIITYHNLARELPALNEQRYYMLAFDESHNIKNFKAQRTVAAMSLRGVRRALITGSPFLNSVDELWSQLFMISPVEFPNYWRFVQRYAVFGGYKDKKIIGVQNRRELQAKMAPHCLRRTLAQVGEQLPPLTKIPVFVTLTDAQRRAYDEERKASREKLAADRAGGESKPVNPAVRFAKLLGIANTLACAGGEDESSKLDAVTEKVAEIGDHKIVIFGRNILTLRCMQKRLERDLNITAPLICGTHEDGRRMDGRDRAPIIQAFQNDREPRVLLASCGVAREGIDLYAAHYGIVIDKLFVPELMGQIYRRLQRTGQKADQVIIFEMFARDTVESRVERILKEKAGTFDSVMNEDDVFSTVLSESWEEILAG